MATKQQSAGAEPAEVFRQFAWHLAGSLAAGRGESAAPATGKPHPAKPSAKR